MAEGGNHVSSITSMSATTLAEAIRSRSVLPSEAVEAYLARITEVNQRLNAVVQLAAERARFEARKADQAIAQGDPVGPLHGVPFTVKDSLCTAGIVTTAGTLGRSSFIPHQDATAVARLRAAGGILLGKTNCAELCGSGETDNQVYGRTNNPHDLSRSPGGSSGGEAAIIAAGGSPLGLASDFGGSIRGPAHLCGIVGLNPTMGRVPRTGHIPPYGGAYDTARIGVMARSVSDLALVLPIIAGPDGIDPSVAPVPFASAGAVDLRALRIAFHADNGIFSPAADVAAVVRQTARTLIEAGVTVVEDCPPALKEITEVGVLLGEVSQILDRGGVYEEFRQPIDLTPDALLECSSLWVKRSRRTGVDGILSAAELLAWTRRWDLCRSHLLGYLNRYDAIICPVDPFPALPQGTTMQPGFPLIGVTAYTKPYSLAGWPAVVVPAGKSSVGLPIGVQVVAGPWHEDIALAIAAVIERVGVS
jgi:amidase